jgi:hypothetical protein
VSDGDGDTAHLATVIVMVMVVMTCDDANDDM